MQRRRTFRVLLPVCALTISWSLMAQGQGGNQAQAPESYSSDPLVQALKWRNIGNANLIGRISAIDALDNDFTHVVVGSASGGVFKSTNAGNTWTPIFDNYGAASIGDVKIFQKDPNIIWIGTGEECGRNSAAWGDGIYKSTDGGKTFTNMGLKDTYNIGAIVVHPTDPNIVYVAAVGNIWGRIGDRGFYKTIDGGKTWTKLTNNLPADGWTGAIDARMDPTNPNVLYVGFWERKRTAWSLDSGGIHGGIFKTTDGGKTFRQLTKGLPAGKTGKIGLAIARTNPKVVMAHVEAEYQPPDNTPEFRDLSKTGAGIYRSEDGGETWTFMNRYNRRPFYYNHLAISPFNDKETYHYNITFERSTDGGKTLVATGRGGGGGGGFGGGNQPSTAPQGSGMHCWHAIWLDPHNKKRFWIGSDGGLALTHDDGESYLRFENLNVTQYYDVAVDMRDPYWVCGGLQDAGSSCGPSATRATAIYTSDWVNTSGGDGYHAAMDPDDNRTVYTESQPATSGGNIVRFDRATGQSQSIRPRKGVNIVNYDAYITPEIEKRQKDLNWGEAPPPPPPGQRGGGRGGFGGGGGGGRGGGGATMGAFRWNWSTPFILSEFNARTLYVGANHVFKSTDRGDHWRIASPDLTKNDPEKTLRKSGGLTPDEDPGGGAEFYGTIVTVVESTLSQGEIWVGTDDGNVQVTRNDGGTWEEVGKNMQGLPNHDLYVSRVEPSHHARGTAYVSIDGHEAAIFKPFVYKTTDYGKTWTNIGGSLPDGGPVYVVKEDLKNPNLLFVGTEFAVFYSADGGKKWSKLNNNLPTVAIHDLVIHPRDNDLIAATHGRGLWIMDDITPLQQLSEKVTTADAHLFQSRTATQWLRLQPHGTGGSLGFRGENPTRNAVINYYLGPAATGQVRFEIADVSGENKRTLTVPARAGINRLEWTMTFDPTPEQLQAFQAAQAAGRGRQGGGGGGEAPGQPPAGGGGRGRGGAGGGPQGDPAGPGEYRVTMTVNGKAYATKLTVRPDPLLDR